MKKAFTEKEVTKKKLSFEKLISVRGIVIPAEWDDEGKACAFAISSLDEKDYLIEQDEKGKELICLIRKEIEAKGIVRKENKGRNTIKVKSYRLKNHCIKSKLTNKGENYNDKKTAYGTNGKGRQYIKG